MTLVDTSIWIDHLKQGEPGLVRLLDDDQVLMHSWVRGELALGTLKDRRQFLDLSAALPACPVVPDAEVMELIESAALSGTGIGWVDAQLLAACVGYPCRLWTKDKRLADWAAKLGVAPSPGYT